MLKVFSCLLYFTLLNVEAYTQKNNKVIDPMPDGFYSQKHFWNDVLNAYNDQFYGKREVSFYKAIKKTDEPVNTIVFDGSIPVEKILDYIKEPSTLSFSGGKAFTSINSEARFITEVEYIGNRPLPKDIKSQIEKFSIECIEKGYEPDGFLIEGVSDSEYAIIAIAFTKQGKIRLYQRINSTTTKTGTMQTFLNFLAQNFLKCLQMPRTMS